MSYDTIRRLENMIRIGTVARVDHAQARCVVDCGGIMTAPLPWLTPRAGTDRTWDAPTVGEQVLVIAPGGEMMQAVVIMGLYHVGHPAPASQPNIKTRHYEDGCVITYDTAAHSLTAILPAGGTATLTATGGVTVNATAGVTINATGGGVAINGNTTIQGSLSVSDSTSIGGSLSSQGNISTPSDVSAAGISLQSHKHQEQGDGKLTSGAI